MVAAVIGIWGCRSEDRTILTYVWSSSTHAVQRRGAHSVHPTSRLKEEPSLGRHWSETKTQVC